ncbi:MAG: hypothetical protein HZB75_03380 [Candidatus Saccharibacteria bacterium]|nr:MAG: hypothetical protein HZB75_03380 [Candidatus Saccharibacteria bacterium]
MSSEESRLEIAATVLTRGFRDHCVRIALEAGVIDIDRAAALRKSDNLQEVVDALGEDLQTYAHGQRLTPEQFDVLCNAIFPNPLNFI